MARPAEDGAGDPADDRAPLGRTSTAERVAGILRTRVAEGRFPPGTRLSEDGIGVSRNTLREAFRLLTHERLLVHELNRGVFVRVLDAGDVADIHRTRGLVECAVVRGLGRPPFALDGLAAAVEEGEDAARAGDWNGVSTADIHFHRALVALAGSARTDEPMRGVLAELRLALHLVDDPRALHEPFPARNREILGALRAGERGTAERLLARYLDDSRAGVEDACARAAGARDRASGPGRIRTVSTVVRVRT